MCAAFSSSWADDNSDGVDAGLRYQTAGWGAVPLPRGKKDPPAKGCTGHGAADLNGADYLAWRDDPLYQDGNIGIRMPDDVIGIDVDHYGDKRGLDTLAELMIELGDLPATWHSSARKAGGIWFFRVPPGLLWMQGIGSGLDIIQRSHRYAAVWPSQHPEQGPYRWHRPSGQVVIGEIPEVKDLPMLPAAWVERLSRGPKTGDAAVEAKSAEAAIQWLTQFPNEIVCGMLRVATERHLDEFANLRGAGAHDTLVRSYGHLIRLALEGHLGVLPSMSAVGKAFVKEVTGSHRGSGGSRRLTEAAARVESRSVVRWLTAAMEHDARISDCRCAEQFAPPPTPGLVRASISIGAELPTRRAVEAALGVGSLQAMFRHGGQLVWVPSLETGTWVPGSSTVEPVVTTSALQGVLGRHAYCYRTNDQGVQREDAVPRPYLEPVLHLIYGLPNVREIEEIVTTPVFLRDSTMLQEPGYADGVLYLPPEDYQGLLAPEKPTKAEMRAAVKVLDYLLADFSFCSADGRANYFALLMAPLIRRMLDHPLPLGVFTAPSKGSGKTFLADALKTLHGGILYAGLSNHDELAKKITTALLTPGGVTVFDNVKTTVAGESLEAVLTTNVWRDRILGTQRAVEVVNRKLWCITSNNATISDDIMRRAIVVEIDPQVERPYLRDDFQIADWPGYVAGHREELTVALMTMVQYALTTAPVQTMGRSDSFTGFVALAQHVLRHCGVAGEVMSRKSTEAVAATDSDDFREFIYALQQFAETGLIDLKGFTIRELMKTVRHNGLLYDGAQRLSEIFDEYGVSRRVSLPNARNLGRWMTKWEGVVVDGLALRKRMGHATTLVWSLTTAAGTGGGE